MKNKIIRLLHWLLGWENYLFVFTVFKIRTLKFDKRKKDYLFFTNQFSPASNVIVIGGCTGITTIPLAQKAGKVVVFEPLPYNFNTIEKAARFFSLSNVKLFPFALGNVNDEIQMVLPVVENTKKQGFAHVIDPGITLYNEGIRFNVSMKRLDDLEELQQTPFEGLKIVAENYEEQIFLGAREFILRNKPLIYCELWNNPKRAIVLSLVKSWGYKVMVNDSGRLADYRPEIHKEKYFFFNYE